MADLLEGLTDKELEHLEAAINRRKNIKVDYDHMTDTERWNVNKTIHPITPPVPYQEYPRALYGIKEGQLVTVTVDDREHEQVIREQYDYDWKYAIKDHGIETAPSHGDGIKAVDFAAPQAVPEIKGGLKPAEFAQGLIQAQENAGKRGPGRPRKQAA